MTVGIPGTGLGGIFYIVTALAMPVREMIHGVRRLGNPEAPRARWGLALGQAALALGILGGLAAAGWLLVDFIPGVSEAVASDGGGALAQGNLGGNAMLAGSVLLACGTLSAVVGVVEALSLVRRRRVGRD